MEPDVRRPHSGFFNSRCCIVVPGMCWSDMHCLVTESNSCGNNRIEGLDEIQDISRSTTAKKNKRCWIEGENCYLVDRTT